MEWLDSKQIKIAPPKKTKKVTGTRFATVLWYGHYHSD